MSENIVEVDFLAAAKAREESVYQKHKEALGPWIKKILQIEAFLKDLNYNPTKEAKKVQADITNIMPWDELIEAMTSSTEADWRSDPDYYWALTDTSNIILSKLSADGAQE